MMSECFKQKLNQFHEICLLLSQLKVNMTAGKIPPTLFRGKAKTTDRMKIIF